MEGFENIGVYILCERLNIGGNVYIGQPPASNMDAKTSNPNIRPDDLKDIVTLIEEGIAACNSGMTSEPIKFSGDQVGTQIFKLLGIEFV